MNYWETWITGFTWISEPTTLADLVTQGASMIAGGERANVEPNPRRFERFVKDRPENIWVVTGSQRAVEQTDNTERTHFGVS
jgi:hypothetical protein